MENPKDQVFLAMLDLNDFKHINDIYGHLCGDEILKELAKIAKDTFINDFVSRYGGEEFIIILKMNGDINNAFEMTDSFRKIIEEHEFIFNNEIIRLTITSGFEAYKDNDTIENWIGSADKKLYLGKGKGKNITVM